MTTFVLDPVSVAPSIERVLPRTYLPLDRFARLVAYSPMLFHQVYVADLQPDSSCSDPVLQYTWQPAGGGRPGREEIAQAIQQAESAIEDVLKFPPIPAWVVDDDARVYNSYSGYGCCYVLGVRASARHVLYGGVEAWSLIEGESPVTYSDVDGDGYKELATVVVNTSVTDVNEIACYYPGTTHAPEWEIRPLRVSITSGVATITFPRHLAVVPELLESLDARGVDGAVDANFLEAVDVYRHYNDPSQMAQVEWSPSICDTSACMVGSQTACVSPVDKRLGLLQVHAASWDSATQLWTHTYPTWWQPPTRTRLWYRAGLTDSTRPRPMHDITPRLERAIAFLALSMLDRDWQACEQTRNLQAHWRTDLSKRESDPAQSTSYMMSPRLLENPFGTTRAAIHAWRVVQQLMVGEAVLAR